MPAFINNKKIESSKNIIEHLTNQETIQEKINSLSIKPDINIDLRSNPNYTYSSVNVNVDSSVNSPEFTSIGSIFKKSNTSNIIIPTSTKSYPYGYPNGYTISFYIYPTAKLSETGFILAQGNTFSNQYKSNGEGWFITMNTNDTISFAIADTASNNGKNGNTTNPLIINKWNSVTIIFPTNVSNKYIPSVSIFVNGVLTKIPLDVKANSNLPGSYVFYAQPNYTPIRTPFNGYIQNFIVFPGQLSQNDISILSSVSILLSNSVGPSPGPIITAGHLVQKIINSFTSKPDINLSLTTNPNLIKFANYSDAVSVSVDNSTNSPEFTKLGCTFKTSKTGVITIPAISYSNGYTISFNIYPRSKSSGQILSQGGTYDTGARLNGTGWFITMNDDNTITFTGADTKAIHSVDGRTKNALNLNQWNSICILFSSNLGIIDIYINSVLTTISIAVSTNSNLPGVYSLYAQPGDPYVRPSFDGYIQNFVVYPSRLSQTDINTLSNVNLYLSTVMTPLSIINPFLTTIAPLEATSTFGPLASSIDILNTQTLLLDTLNTFNTSTSNQNILNSLADLTTNSIASVVVSAPPVIANTIVNNPTTYPNLVGSTLPVTIASTVKSGNVETIDPTQLYSNSIVVVPSLVEGSKINIGGTTIIRGMLNTVQAKQLSVDNGATWNNIGTFIVIGNLKLRLMGISSPVVLIATPESSLKGLDCCTVS
jgi:hypothetical protein